MDYDKFLAAIRWTRQEWEKRNPTPASGYQKHTCCSYPALRERGDEYWLHLEKMNSVWLEEEIVDCFLNTSRWYCHLDPPHTLRRRSMVCNLKKAVDQLPEYYADLKGLRIEDFDTEGNVFLKGREKPVTFVIDSIYSIFRNVEFNFAKVAASKLMHMALPDILMMWDNDIIDGYNVPRQNLVGFTKRVRSYTAFLILMQENIRHIKETCPGGSHLTNHAFQRQINKGCGYEDLPITRLLDIANYAVAHPEKGAPPVKCDRCIQVTNSRLDKLAWSRQNRVGRFR